jgi:hypothetical protein
VYVNWACIVAVSASSSSSRGRSLWQAVSISHSKFREKVEATLSPHLRFYSIG